MIEIVFLVIELLVFLNMSKKKKKLTFPIVCLICVCVYVLLQTITSTEFSTETFFTSWS